MAGAAAAEYNDMHLRADQLTDQSLDSTRRTRQMAEEALTTGVETMVVLDEQGEQLNRIDRRLDDINEDLTHAERNIREIQKCCGLCVCPCSSGIIIGQPAKAKFDQGIVTEEPRSMTSARGGGGGRAGGGEGPFIQHVLADDREEEMDENLHAISGLVGQMKNVAMDMGTELERQNVQIGGITDKTEFTDFRTSKANRAVRKELRK
eukprot:m.10159 g.10159  ORF g.10159 m.10159 type:complete len:207 (+) comp21979_c0_seq1:323-943(+)